MTFREINGTANSPLEMNMKKHQSLLINGFSVPVERPFFALLSFRRRARYCGAAIIDPFWLITAAHCVYAARSKLLTFV